MDKIDKLAEVLSEFAHTLVSDFPMQGILDHLVGRIVDILPIDSAGVALISASKAPEFVAGSNKTAVHLEHLQTELGEGPCLATYNSQDTITIPDLTLDERFPRYAQAALSDGLKGVFTFPLRNGDRCLGALGLYRESTGELSKEDLTTAQTLADVTTAYLLNAEARSTKANFVAAVSHELRTPLTSIAASAELLQDRTPGPFTAHEERLVDSIVRNSDRLTALTNNLLTVFSLESGAPHSEHADLDFRTVIAAVRSAMGPAIAIRAVEATFTVPVEPVVVRGNHFDLESVTSNLISNALKFTHDGGRLHCALIAVAGSAYLHVSDNGIGITEVDQENLFTRFFRSSAAREQAIPGSGLGLSIVDTVVRSHGGHVSVVSKHLNGSTFTVRLPLAEALPSLVATPA